MNDSSFIAAVQEEIMELLEELEEALLELDDHPEDMGRVSRIFRIMHTVKGSGSMAGFDQVADFTHRVETVLDMVRNGELAVSKKLIDLVLASRDQIKELARADVAGTVGDGQAAGKLLADLEGLLAGEDQGAYDSKAQAGKGVEEQERKDGEGELRSHYYLHFKAGNSFLEGGGDREQYLAMVAELGKVTVVADDKSEPEGKEERPFCDVLLTTGRPRQAIEDLSLLFGDDSVFSVTCLGDDDGNDLPEHKRLGEILVERGKLSVPDLQEALAKQKPLGELLVEARLVDRDDVRSALAEQKIIKERKNAASSLKAADNVKVNAEKLDHLVNLVGELVVLQSRLTQFASGSERGELRNISKVLERLTSEMRDSVLGVRMLPIGSTFSRFKRLVRDLSAELGKDVEMVTEGAETELDKSVIDKLGEPLVHMIRNCIDHGIESPEERRAAGKPGRGTVTLAAMHSGAKVVLTIADDGKGLDAELIRSKAVEKSIISPESKLTEDEIFKLLFAPGFSTAREVSSVSGRGVGMDVVKKTIEGQLKGAVRISSVKGRGTTVTIALPLTLAIIDGLMVKVGRTHFVLPLASVERCVELSREDVERFHGRRVFPLKDQIVPYVRLRDFFAIKGTPPELEQMVIAQVEGRQVGFVLDEVIGGHQTVIKNLGWAYRNAEGVSGATILGNGEVALIVDLPAVTNGAEREETAHVANVRMDGREMSR